MGTNERKAGKNGVKQKVKAGSARHHLLASDTGA